MAKNMDSFILNEKNKISDFIAKISYDMYNYIQSKINSKFVMFYKYLTHSDLATFGKATHVDSYQNNLLYYIKEDEMKNIEQQTGKPFQTAHQSCIGLKTEFYNDVGLPNPRDTGYLINDYMDVLLVNETIKYFSSKYTKLVFDKLNKSIEGRKKKSWNFDNLNLNLNNDSPFTPMNLHVAVHGLGVEEDKEFHKLRHHLFKGDTFILLYEHDNNTGSKKLFIITEKNPIFFSIIGESNKAYQKYQEQTRARLIDEVRGKTNAVAEDYLEDEVTRAQQSAWRDMLAKEIMGYTQVNNQVFCPFTYITADYNDLGTLFRASHIKGFSDENTKNEEKYDINNGLLLCANADALFDKHLITIDENKQLVFSFLLDNDIKLKQQLLLLQPIFQPILNESRMKYIEYHRNVFKEFESKRKKQ